MTFFEKTMPDRRDWPEIAEAVIDGGVSACFWIALLWACVAVSGAI